MTSLYNVCLEGNINKVLDAIEKGAINWNSGLYGACRGCHIDIVNLMIEKGANNWNVGLNEACKQGHVGIAELMIDNGANIWHRGLMKACQYGHMNIINLLAKRRRGLILHKDTLNYGLIMACHGGSRGPTHTLTGVYIDIINFLIDKGANNMDGALIGTLCGTSYGNICDICEQKFINRRHMQKYDDDYEYGPEESENARGRYVSKLYRKRNYRDISIIKLLISKGAAITSYYQYVYPCHHKDIMELLELGLTISELHPIKNISILANKLKQFKEATYNKLYQYMPKELAKLVSNYCLL